MSAGGKALVAEGLDWGVSATASGGGNAIVASNNGTGATANFTNDGSGGVIVANFNNPSNGSAGIFSRLNGAANASAIRGTDSTGSASSIGVEGSTTSGIGVKGISSVGGIGVWGSSSSGPGVNASSTSGVGLNATSSSNFGMSASGTDGLYATGTNYGVEAYGGPTGLYASGNTEGVHATTTGNQAVFAQGGTNGVLASGGATGVSATSTQSGGTGVYGLAGISPNQGYGVRGNVGLGSINNIGVVGTWNSATVPNLGGGAGVAGVDLGSNGLGVLGIGAAAGVSATTSNASGYGLYAENSGTSGFPTAIYGRSMSTLGSSTGVEGDAGAGPGAIGVLGKTWGTNSLAGIAASNTTTATSGSPSTALDIDGGITIKTRVTDPVAGMLTATAGGWLASGDANTKYQDLPLTSTMIKGSSLIFVTPAIANTGGTADIVDARVQSQGNGTATIRVMWFRTASAPATNAATVNYLIVNTR
jgi:hypothetical protein